MQDEILRILFGAEETAAPWFYLEIIVRTLVMYLYTIFLARMVGQGGIGQIGPFEFVLVIAVGSAAGDPMFYPEVGLFQGILVITVVIVLHRLTGFIFTHHQKLEDKVEGLPVCMVENGRILPEALGSGTLSERELMAMLRVEGVRDTGEVEHAYLETSGKISVFWYHRDTAKPVRSTMPAKTE